MTRARLASPARQAQWTRLGSVMGYTDTEPKRAEIRAAVAAMVWVEPDDLAEVLHAAPVRFVLAGLFHTLPGGLRHAAVASVPAGCRCRGECLIGLESATGDRYVLLDTGHEAIDILHASAPVVAEIEGQQSTESAARHLYEAEVALHIAHQSHVDAWIIAAANRLHDAVVEHLRTVESAHHGAAR